MTYSDLLPLFRHAFGKKPALTLTEMADRLTVEGTIAKPLPPALRGLAVGYRRRTHVARLALLLRYRRES